MISAVSFRFGRFGSLALLIAATRLPKVLPARSSDALISRVKVLGRPLRLTRRPQNSQAETVFGRHHL
jgi:hypothetical protein